MVIDDVIKSEQKQAREHYEKAMRFRNIYGDDTPGYFIHKKVADEHLQIAEWLKELKEMKEKEKE